MELIDISLPLCSRTPVWPGSTEFELTFEKRLDAGDDCNNTRMACDTHTGTHIDAPSHFIAGGRTVDDLSLDILIGPATVSSLPDIDDISAADLQCLSLPPDTKRLLLRTRNSKLWQSGVGTFQKDFVGLVADAAEWIVEKGIRLVGVDYLSVASFRDIQKTHRILLDGGVVLLEGINLYHVDAREYELICLPLYLIGAEGAPARAVLRTIE